MQKRGVNVQPGNRFVDGVFLFYMNTFCVFQKKSLWPGIGGGYSSLCSNTELAGMVTYYYFKLFLKRL